jgi:pimeloyl-ACP methyl ester carboxylesterase
VTATWTLDDRWALVRSRPVFYRESSPAPGARVMLHLHGFAISGRYMVPTAELLADEFRTLVPDLPGFGRSVDPDHGLSIPELADSAAAFLDEVGVERATVLGNSLGCAVLASFAHRHPDRMDRAIMVSPAGGRHSQPLLRAVVQLGMDAPREPLSMAAVAGPDYLRFGVIPTFHLFREMMRFPAMTRLLELQARTLIVVGSRDPLMPPVDRFRKGAALMRADTTVVYIKDAAHAVNYSHPRELAAVVRQFMDDEPVVGLPDDPTAARVARLAVGGGAPVSS